MGIDEKSLFSIALMSAGASAACEGVAVIFYYPFDLIKARMQRSGEYKYKNVTDAFYQIGSEKADGYRISNFYRGCGIFALVYGMYTILEFTIYETLLAALTNYTKHKDPLYHNKVEDSVSTSHAKERKLSHIIVCSFTSGAVSALFLNPFELLLAHTQTTKEKSLRQIIKGIPNIASLWKGVHFSMTYYGLTA